MRQLISWGKLLLEKSPLLHSFQFQARPVTVVPQTIPLWPLLQLCISIPGQTGVSCPPNRFRCEDSIHCLPITMLCDGVVDCPDRSDEGVFCRKFVILIQNLNALCRVCKMKPCLLWASVSSTHTERIYIKLYRTVSLKTMISLSLSFSLFLYLNIFATTHPKKMIKLMCTWGE